MERKHMAFKCAYNDNKGGDNPVIGYMGACSRAATVYNVKKGAPWCSLPECPCSSYILKGEPRPESPCYECRMLIEWKAYAGFDHDAPYSWTPRRITGAGEGGLCFLTTRYPGTGEAERFIFAAFLVAKVVQYDPDKSGWVQGDEKLRLALAPDELVYFWDYYRNANRPGYVGWGSGRYRYLADSQAEGAMRAICSAIKGAERKQLALEMMDRALGTR